MTRQPLPLFLFTLVMVILLSLPGQVGAAPAGMAGLDPVALLAVELDSPQDLERFTATGLPAYARLGSERGTTLLVGADAAGLEALQQAGLSARVLDADLAGASYYLAGVMPGRLQPEWGSYGRVLLEFEGQVLLRSTAGQAERLARAGAELRAVSLVPKPLGPFEGRGFPSVIEPDPLIQQMIDQVDSDTVYSYTGGLSGAWPVQVGGEDYTITSRYTYSGESIQKATQYVGEHLANLGLDVEYHQWGGETYPNVIGELPGLTNPDEIYIIGGHLDDVSGAPGADDNGSGSVATMIAADILSQYQWGCTLRFAFWTGEEQGLNGSYAYAQRAYNQGENILGYLNLDMIAWNTLGSPRDIDLYYDASMPPTLELAQLFADVVDAYNLNLIPELGTSMFGGSDHQSFWDFGYTSILAIEDEEDFNPYYHGPGDNIDHIDLGYYTDYVKAAIGATAHMTSCLIPRGFGSMDGHVTAADTGAPVTWANIQADGSAGYDFSAATDASGYYTATLFEDTYTVTASAYGYFPQVAADVTVITGELTTQDFVLEAAPTYLITGTVTETGTGLPLRATISFDGAPVQTETDPATGAYAIGLEPGSYTMHVSADDHQSAEREILVVAGESQRQDFSLDPRSCILLVDDDQDTPNVRSYYTLALDNLGYGYDVWDVKASGAAPGEYDLKGYDTVLWYTGAPDADAFLPGNEADVSAYLDSGGNFLLSSQGYLNAADPEGDFLANYLGLASFDLDVSHTSLVGRAGDPIGDGLGPYSLIKPPGWSSLKPDSASGVQGTPFEWFAQGGEGSSARYAAGGFKTVFLGWPAESISRLSDREEILGSIQSYFGGCPPPSGTLEGVVSDLESGEPVAGATVTAQPGDGLSAVSDELGFYTLVLPTGYYTVTAEAVGYLPQSVTSLAVYADAVVQQNFELEGLPPAIVVDPLLLSATLAGGETITKTFTVSNTGEGPLSISAVDPAEAWADIAPLSATLMPGESLEVQVTFAAGMLPVGLHETSLEINSNDPLKPQTTVDLKLMVVTPAQVLRIYLPVATVR